MSESLDDYLDRALSAAFVTAARWDSSGRERESVQHTLAPITSGAVPGNVGRYPVEGIVGRGGTSIVLRVRDTELDRPIALKLLHEHLAREPEWVARFVEEARVGGGLEHPGSVPVYELGRADDGRP